MSDLFGEEVFCEHCEKSNKANRTNYNTMHFIGKCPVKYKQKTKLINGKKPFDLMLEKLEQEFLKGAK